MATFGTPSSGPDDASRALRCAVTLAAETSRWSAERVARGELPVEIGNLHELPAIGRHFSPPSARYQATGIPDMDRLPPP